MRADSPAGPGTLQALQLPPGHPGCGVAEGPDGEHHLTHGCPVSPKAGTDQGLPTVLPAGPEGHQGELGGWGAWL